MLNLNEILGKETLITYQYEDGNWYILKNAINRGKLLNSIIGERDGISNVDFFMLDNRDGICIHPMNECPVDVITATYCKMDHGEIIEEHEIEMSIKHETRPYEQLKELAVRNFKQFMKEKEIE